MHLDAVELAANHNNKRYYYEENHRADLIIMGTLGAIGLKTVLFGAKAAAVINKSHVPVITVPYDYASP